MRLPLLSNGSEQVWSARSPTFALRMTSTVSRAGFDAFGQINIAVANAGVYLGEDRCDPAGYFDAFHNWPCEGSGRLRHTTDGVTSTTIAWCGESRPLLQRRAPSACTRKCEIDGG